MNKLTFWQKSRQRTSFCLSELKMAKNSISMYLGLHKGMFISRFEKNQLLCESNKFTIMRREYKKMIFLESLSVQTIQPHCCKDVPACNWSILSRENFSGGYLWCQNTLATHPALEPIKRKKTRSDVRALLDLDGRHCSGVIVQCTSIFHDKDSNTFKALLLVLIKTFAKDDADNKLLKRISWEPDF